MRKRKRPADIKGRPKERQPARPLVEATVERILPGGAGLAHADGRTLLVALAAPGDRVRARVERTQGSVSFASIAEVIEPSPARVEPPCPYFGRCGGCDFQQLSYPAQLDAKVGIIRDCLRRIARLDFAQEVPITPSPSVWNYRSRAQWQRDPVRRLLGYFERASHRVCDVAACPVLAPELEAALEDLRGQVRGGALAEELTEFQAVAGDEGASLAPPAEGLPTREVSRLVGGHRYRFSAEGFFQINHALLGPLVDCAAGEARGETAVDLYCGAGLFTLPLARRFARVLGVEANSAAVQFARRNLAEAGLGNATFEVSRVGDWLREAAAAALAPVDFLLLDPPRSGAEEGALEGILALGPRRISYVSCDPATLARDLKGLVAGGYRLDRLAAFDMFPQTHHVEAVAHLSSGA